MLFRRRGLRKRTGKVVLFGATSPVGQPLSLLLKLCPHVAELVCCATALDRPQVAVADVAADLSHMDTDARVLCALKTSEWPAALHDANLVLVCCGDSFDPLCEDRDIALATTAPAVAPIMRAIAESKCKGSVALVSSPVNALLPYCAELLKKEGRFDPRKMFGVTTLDVVRTRCLVADALGKNPFDISIPVVGGRGGVTACPLIAQTDLPVSMDDVVQITGKVQQYGAPFEHACESEGDATLPATEAAPPASLGLAQAAYEFAVSLLKAQRGDFGITECAYVESTMRPETPFFSSRVRLGEEGVEAIPPMGRLTTFEHDLVEAAVPQLVKDIEAGVAFAQRTPSSLAEQPVR